MIPSDTKHIYGVLRQIPGQNLTKLRIICGFTVHDRLGPEDNAGLGSGTTNLAYE